MTKLALAWLIIGAGAATQEAVSLRFTPAENQENKYKLEVKLKYNSEDITFSADLSNRVVQVLDDGSFVVATTQKNAQMLLAGSPVKYPETNPTFTTYSKLGQASGITGDDINSEDYRFTNLTALIWPDHPVKIDEAWSIEQKGNAETGAIATKGQYRLLAQEEILGRKCNKVSFEVIEQAGSDPASAKGIAWVDRTTGFTVKLAAELKKAPLAGTQVDAVMELTMVPLT
jgi:hypothetical protein